MRANSKSISHRCHLFEVAVVCELTKETIHLPLGCLQARHLDETVADADELVLAHHLLALSN